jgi:hypothetical protein
MATAKVVVRVGEVHDICMIPEGLDRGLGDEARSDHGNGYGKGIGPERSPHFALIHVELLCEVGIATGVVLVGTFDAPASTSVAPLPALAGFRAIRRRRASSARSPVRETSSAPLRSGCCRAARPSRRSSRAGHSEPRAHLGPVHSGRARSPEEVTDLEKNRVRRGRTTDAARVEGAALPG